MAASTPEEILEQLPQGQKVVVGIESFKLQGKGGALTKTGTEEPHARKAYRIHTEGNPTSAYSLQIGAANREPVHKGDILIARFSARTVGELPPEGEARLQFVFELGTAPYTKLSTYPAVLENQWQNFYVPFEASMDLEVQQAQARFQLGYANQTVEIADVELLNYGRQVAIADLPHTDLTYSGHAANAAWRSAAAERIEQIRKSDLKLIVKDASGKPLPNAEVRLEQTKHAFRFGSAVSEKLLLSSDPEGDTYRKIFLQNFNTAVIENGMKWEEWERNPKAQENAVQWLLENHIAVRGHCLLWGSRRRMPKRISELWHAPEKVRASILDHVHNEMTAFKGKLIEWDVLNEPFTEKEVHELLGEAFYVELFRAAREVDPDIKLDINDFSILESGGQDLKHQDFYEHIIQLLINSQAPLGGIGMQSHFSNDLTSIPKAIKILDRFARFGLPIQATEFDVNVWDEKLQADYTRDFMTALFSHPGVSGIVVWGFWEKRHWIPNAAFYRADWSPRPIAEVWRQLTQEQWHTHASGRTDAAGTFTTRGFLGDYSVTVQSQQKTHTESIQIIRGSNVLEITLP